MTDKRIIDYLSDRRNYLESLLKQLNQELTGIIYSDDHRGLTGAFNSTSLLLAEIDSILSFINSDAETEIDPLRPKKRILSHYIYEECISYIHNTYPEDFAGNSIDTFTDWLLRDKFPVVRDSFIVIEEVDNKNETGWQMNVAKRLFDNFNNYGEEDEGHRAIRFFGRW